MLLSIQVWCFLASDCAALVVIFNFSSKMGVRNSEKLEMKKLWYLNSKFSYKWLWNRFSNELAMTPSLVVPATISLGKSGTVTTVGSYV